MSIGREIPPSHRPISEQFRLTGMKWVDLDDAARILEETKTAVLAKKKSDLGNIPDSKAETAVKATEEWLEFLKNMVKARTEANKMKIEMEFLRMKFHENNNKDANARHELRLSRG